jgi:tetratricopeptide (TPR) repeat protein
MFSLLVAALVSTSLDTSIVPSQVSHSPVHTTYTVVALDTPAQIIEKARAAQAAGDLQGALKEFMRAIRLQRADGLLSVDASYGAAHVLNLQARHHEAADVLDQLAADANLIGDADVEARVLLDVVSLKVEHHRKAAARSDALRLKELFSDVRLTSETRRLIKTRLT